MSKDARIIVLAIAFTLSGLAVGYEEGKKVSDKWCAAHARQILGLSADTNIKYIPAGYCLAYVQSERVAGTVVGMWVPCKEWPK
jgi:hypothetical protein